MRILHILDHSLPLHSGYSFRTANILREQSRLGWATFQVTGPRQGESGRLEEDVAGLHFHRTPPPPAALALASLRRPWMEMKATETRLMSLVPAIEPDLLHAHSPVLSAVPALRVGRRLGMPVVYEVRAFWEDAAVDHGTTHEGSLRYHATRTLETWALKRVDHIFTICDGLKRDMVSRGISPAKITLIPNAVDIEGFQPAGTPDDRLENDLGLRGATVLGFIGSFYAYEGLDLLIEALPRLLDRRPDLRLLLVGGGPQDEALKAQTRRLGLAEQVIFTGRVPHADVSRYYDLIDMLVYPRRSMRLTELVTPLKPLEAMAQGRILIASDVGGHRELIHDGETGRLFPAGSAEALADVALQLLDQRDTWPAIREAGRRFVEQERNWTRSVSNYIEPYTRLTAARRAP